VTDVLRIERTEGVATLTLNRPESLNSLNLELKLAMLDALSELREDDTVRAIVLTGAGRGFCVGQDLAEHLGNLEAGDPELKATASRSASFLLAFARVGLTLDTGISWLLPRMIGSARATALALLAEPVTAEAALEMGMVNAVVEPDHLLTSAAELAARLANGPTAAYAAIKASLAYAAEATLPQALAKEAELQEQMGSTADHRNATAAFVAKQAPLFVGH
jgi:2-(1,2-epoxy-1,2-dihydrophenyl)acetyl-CoA isomerase